MGTGVGAKGVLAPAPASVVRARARRARPGSRQGPTARLGRHQDAIVPTVVGSVHAGQSVFPSPSQARQTAPPRGRFRCRATIRTRDRNECGEDPQAAAAHRKSAITASENTGRVREVESATASARSSRTSRWRVWRVQRVRARRTGPSFGETRRGSPGSARRASRAQAAPRSARSPIDGRSAWARDRSWTTAGLHDALAPIGKELAANLGAAATAQLRSTSRALGPLARLVRHHRLDAGARDPRSVAPVASHTVSSASSSRALCRDSLPDVFPNRVAVEHLVEHAPEPVDVALGSIDEIEALGSHVPDRSEHERARLRFARIEVGARDAEVEDLRLARGGDLDVRRLDVAVEDSQRPSRRDRRRCTRRGAADATSPAISSAGPAGTLPVAASSRRRSSPSTYSMTTAQRPSSRTRPSTCTIARCRTSPSTRASSRSRVATSPASSTSALRIFERDHLREAAVAEELRPIHRTEASATHRLEHPVATPALIYDRIDHTATRCDPGSYHRARIGAESDWSRRHGTSAPSRCGSPPRARPTTNRRPPPVPTPTRVVPEPHGGRRRCGAADAPRRPLGRADAASAHGPRRSAIIGSTTGSETTRRPGSRGVHRLARRPPRAGARVCPRTSMTARDRITRSLFEEGLAREKDTDVCAFEQWTVSARDNPMVEWNRLPEDHPVVTVADGRNLVARYRAIPTWIDNELALLRDGHRERPRRDARERPPHDRAVRPGASPSRWTRGRSSIHSRTRTWTGAPPTASVRRRRARGSEGRRRARLRALPRRSARRAPAEDPLRGSRRHGVAAGRQMPATRRRRASTRRPIARPRRSTRSGSRRSRASIARSRRSGRSSSVTRDLAAMLAGCAPTRRSTSDVGPGAGRGARKRWPTRRRRSRVVRRAPQAD